MTADVYKPELWNGFFTMVGGGVAGLSGLVFVALSLNVREMTDTATHKYRSINTLAGLTAVFVGCGLVLMGGQNHLAVGMELFLIGAIGAGIFWYGFQQAFKLGSHPNKQRLAVGSALYVAQLVGALLFTAGAAVGLYLAAAAMVLNVAFMISAAWLLVVGVYAAVEPGRRSGSAGNGRTDAPPLFPPSEESDG